MHFSSKTTCSNLPQCRLSLDDEPLTWTCSSSPIPNTWPQSWDCAHLYGDFHCDLNTPPPFYHQQGTRTYACTPTPCNLRDTRACFLVKEIALLRWLFYLKPWLPARPPDHAVTGSRRRAEGLIGAWDARGGADGPGGRRGEPLMGFAAVFAPPPPPHLNAPTVVESLAQSYSVIC